MTRCARPGCGVEAVAWLSYDYAGQRVWLDDAGVTAVGHRWALCPTHAGRLRAPRGWSIQDRRTLHPSLHGDGSSVPPGDQAPPGGSPAPKAQPISV